MADKDTSAKQNATEQVALPKTERTKREVMFAMLDLLKKEPLSCITMSELARAAQVSRSTLYQHYANVHEVFADVVNEFDKKTAPVMSQLECYEGVEPEGTQPFCNLLRKTKAYQAAIDDPGFLDMFTERESILEQHSFYQSLISAGYSPAVAKALAVFQINGCYKAVRRYGADDNLWREVREAIDTFICGGLYACQEKKRHQLKGAFHLKSEVTPISEEQ